MAETPEIFSPAYYRQLALLERHHPWFTGTRRVAAAIIPRVLGEPASGLRILDVGCGTGATLRWLRRFAGDRAVTGIDVAPAAVRLARREGNVAVAPSEQLPLRANSFDLVYCADVVQHLEAPERAATLAEMARVLRDGGVAVFRSNRATGSPDLAGGGYAAFDYRAFPGELQAAGLVPAISGTIALLSGIAQRVRGTSAGGGWGSRGLAIRPLRGSARLAGIGLDLGFALEAVAVGLSGRLPTFGASTLFVAVNQTPFERA